MTVWLSKTAVLAIHARQIAEHGGSDGLRDSSILESALARPQQLETYGENIDIAALAASLTFGIAKNHAFVDGNKRTSLVATETFLCDNGYELMADDAACVETWVRLGSGDLSEVDFSKWLRSNIKRA